MTERFRELGYSTVGLSANINIGPEIGFDRGFDRFVRERANVLEGIPGALGAAIGPVLTGRIFDVTGSYALGFALHLAAFLLSAALICFLRRPAFDRISNQGGLP